MELFSKRIGFIGSENAFKLGANIKECLDMGIKVIKFNLGEPDFDTPKHIREEAKAQLDQNNTHYCPPEGLPSFREALARRLSETRKIKIDPNRIIVTPGGKPPISYTFMSYINPGDEVIYPSPGFPIYESWLTYMGGKAVPLHLKESKGFSFDCNELEKLITKKTKLIIINSPSNPTGGVISKGEMEGIAKVIAKKAPSVCRIYSDEIYENIIFDGLKHVSIASMKGMEKRTIIASGHSKSYAMTGWRLGFVVLPTVEEAEVFKNLNINTISCTTPFIQESGREACESAKSKDVIKYMVENFEKRRNWAVPALNDIEGITCAWPKGAFYLFPNVSGVCKNLGIITSFRSLPPKKAKQTSPSRILQMFLLYKYGVATMDRNSFGHIGASGKHFLRISSATSLDLIKKGIGILAQAAKDRDGFLKFFKEGKRIYRNEN